MNENNIGNEVVDQSSATAGATAEPTPLEIREDTFVKLPGSDKPTKYGDWFRGYQQKHTTVSQERAELQRKIQQIENDRRQEQAELQRYRSASNSGPQRPDPRTNLREKVANLQYLNGQEAAQVIDAIYDELGNRDQALQTRDLALRLVAQKVADVMNQVQQLSQRDQGTALKGKIGKWRQELALPEGSEEFLEDLYSAYEGADLDTEFPNIAKARWEQVQGLVRAMDKAKVTEARKARFVPGRGGVGAPTKPVDMSEMDAKEAASYLWDQMQSAEKS